VENNMNKLYAWLCLFGGLLWGAKPVYDWLVLGREINTGYIVFDWSDYIKFTFPLLCLGGILILVSLYKKLVKGSSIILFASLVLNSLFHFSEIYLINMSIPFGLLFLLTGTITLLIGSCSLFLQLRKVSNIPRVLYHLAFGLTVATFSMCLLPFVAHILNDTIETAIMVGMMMLIGFIWAAIGGVLHRILSIESVNIPQTQEFNQ
jgi:hypothetical protein